MRLSLVICLLFAVLAACGTTAPPPAPDSFSDVMAGATGGSRPDVSAAIGRGPAVTGRVDAVDQHFGIVILDIGRQNGVKRGMTFVVYRENAYVGKIVVDDVEADWCSGTTVGKLEKSPVRVGDLVKSEPARPGTPVSHENCFASDSPRVCGRANLANGCSPG